MQTFHVSDMTCSGCAKAITGALHDLDAAAKVDVDLDSKLVTVASSASAEAVAEAMRDAGFTVTQH